MGPKPTIKGTTKRARTLRRNATDAETRLWQILRSRQLANYKFRRQHPIGPFIADFACPEHHLIIEADGGQHAENPDDATRTQKLNQAGWQTLRFWNHEILTNTEGITLLIQQALLNKPDK